MFFGPYLGLDFDNLYISLLKRRKPQNYYNYSTGGPFQAFGRLQNRRKICPKWIKIRSPRWSDSWHRILMDFGRFWEATWVFWTWPNCFREGVKRNGFLDVESIGFQCPRGGRPTLYTPPPPLPPGSDFSDSWPPLGRVGWGNQKLL